MQDSSGSDSFHRIIKSRQFWAFFGSALIVSVAYMDPGNFGTAITAGTQFDYAPEILFLKNQFLLIIPRKPIFSTYNPTIRYGCDY